MTATTSPPGEGGASATIVLPFVVLALFRNHGVRGVLALMIGLLIISIIVIAVWGIEPANRRLEDLETRVGRDRKADARFSEKTPQSMSCEIPTS